MAVTASDLILAYTYDRNGDWDAITHDIKNKKEFDFTATPMATIKSKIFGNYTTLIDEDYPLYAKKCQMKKPLCLFYKGNLNAIEENKSILVYAYRSSKSPALEKYARYALVQTIKKYAPKNDIVLQVSREYHDLAVKAFRKYAGPDSHIAEILQYLNISDYFLTFSERSDLVMSVRYESDYTIKPHEGVVATALQASKKVVVVEGDKEHLPAVVHFALVENKDVEVVPYPFFDKDHSNNNLISEGALMFSVEEQEEEE